MGSQSIFSPLSRLRSASLVVKVYRKVLQLENCTSCGACEPSQWKLWGRSDAKEDRQPHFSLQLKGELDQESSARNSFEDVWALSVRCQELWFECSLPGRQASFAHIPSGPLQGGDLPDQRKKRVTEEFSQESRQRKEGERSAQSGHWVYTCDKSAHLGVKMGAPMIIHQSALSTCLGITNILPVCCFSCQRIFKYHNLCWVHVKSIAKDCIFDRRVNLTLLRLFAHCENTGGHYTLNMR